MADTTLRFTGPNGIFREFQGEANAPVPSLLFRYEMASGRPTGNIVLHLSSGDAQPLTVEIEDCVYGTAPVRKTVRREEKVVWDLQRSSGWRRGTQVSATYLWEA